LQGSQNEKVSPLMLFSQKIIQFPRE